MNSKIDKSLTTQYKVVFSKMLSNQNNLFGGIAMQWMDEVSYVSAMRFTRKKMVTVFTDKIKFLKPENRAILFS